MNVTSPKDFERDLREKPLPTFASRSERPSGSTADFPQTTRAGSASIAALPVCLLARG